MNTTELKRAIRRDCELHGKYVIDVVAADYRPVDLPTLPCGFIVNTDTSNESGKHWLALWIDKNAHWELFDSYAYSPARYRDRIQLVQYMYETCGIEKTFNRKRLQDYRTVVCGEYCLFYLHRKGKRYDMNAIVRRFTDDYLLNDRFIFDYVRRHFHIDNDGNGSCVGRTQMCVTYERWR